MLQDQNMRREGGTGHQAEWLEVFDKYAPPARAYVPFQRVQTLFTPEIGLRKGTIFPDLASPYKPNAHREGLL